MNDLSLHFTKEKKKSKTNSKWVEGRTYKDECRNKYNMKQMVEKINGNKSHLKIIKVINL